MEFKYKPRTKLEALKLSVRKWEKVHQNVEEVNGSSPEDCALCSYQYNSDNDSINCNTCPLSEFGEFKRCANIDSTFAQYDLARWKWMIREGSLKDMERAAFNMFKLLYDLYIDEMMRVEEEKII